MSEPLGERGDDDEVGPDATDKPEVVEARDALDKALGVHARAASLLDAARDALADAEGSLRVAEAKVTDYEDDDDKLVWQRVAAAELVEQARRAAARRSTAVDVRERELGESRTVVDAAGQQLAMAITQARRLDESQTAPVDPAADELPPMVYGSTDEFVFEFLRYAYKRRIDGKARRWAAEWWQYEEAVMRLEALWRAWEHLRLDAALGMSVWWRDHADHHMAILFSEAGPFFGIDGDENTCRRGEPLPYSAPPPGLFPDVRVTG